ncbi:MAG: transporter, partial [Conexibacter sp.]|nr:transporter [Conexibacter sp.]
MTSVQAPRRHYRVTLLVLALDGIAYALLQSLLTPALPTLQRSLGTSASTTAWVMTAYLLSAAVATPIVGRLGDMYGKKRLLVIVLAVLAVGTLAAALSSSIAPLIAARAVQGVGSGVFPLAFAIVRDEFPAERVPAGIGLVSAILGIGASAGTALSGVIVEGLDYHWLFWLPLVLIVVACATSARVVPESPLRTPGRINWLAALLLSAGLAGVLLAITQAPSWGWLSVRTLGVLGVGLALLAGWVCVELRSRAPLVDMRMMRIRAVWTTNLAGLLLAVGMFCAFLLIPQLVEVPASTGFGLGATPVRAGLYLLPTAVMMLVSGVAIGWLERRIGSKPTFVSGAVISVLAFVLLAVAHREPWQIYLAAAVAGIGIGLSFAAMPNLIVATVAAGETGVALGMNTVTRWVGGALGSQMAISVLAAHPGIDGFPAERGFTAAFALTAAVLAVAVGASLA